MWKVIVATLAIFGAGVITGGLLVGYSDRAWHETARLQTAAEVQSPPVERPANVVPGGNRLPAPLPGPLRREFLERLDQELKLTDAQRERIEKIIGEGQEDSRTIWQQIEPQMRAELAKTRQRIRAELTSDQQERFEQLLRQRPREQRRGSDRPANRQRTPSNER